MRLLVVVVLFLGAGCLPPDVRSTPLRESRYTRAEMLFLQEHYDQAREILVDFADESGASQPVASSLKVAISVVVAVS